ncbi:LPXTG cell wall anchor domain-containing protein [Streptomyces sp. 147326]|uniref:LPXTG cell wall anchor domain-containing protein n=1 Tax=Streptomyces sp. 147326 TaxID=3074379 RepID=UPI0038573963
MSARRPLLTALGATTLLAALWFVPSAGATSPGAAESLSGVPAGANTAESGDGSGTGTVTGTAEAAGAQPPSVVLADTGSIDTTPYLLGGTLFLGVGAGFVAFSVRRSHSASPARSR